MISQLELDIMVMEAQAEVHELMKELEEETPDE